MATAVTPDERRRRIAAARQFERETAALDREERRISAHRTDTLASIGARRADALIAAIAASR